MTVGLKPSVMLVSGCQAARPEPAEGFVPARVSRDSRHQSVFVALVALTALTAPIRFQSKVDAVVLFSIRQGTAADRGIIRSTPVDVVGKTKTCQGTGGFSNLWASRQRA